MSKDTVLQLELDETTRILTACYTPASADAGDTADAAMPTTDSEQMTVAAIAPTLEDLQALVAEHGWSCQALDMEQAIVFIALCHSAEATLRAPVGAVLDGSFELEITPDKMSVLLTLHQPKGGQPLTLEKVRQGLAEQKIVHGIRHVMLHDLVQIGYCDSTLVAEGTPPKPGRPGRYESLLDSLRSINEDDFDEDATIDYRALGQLLLVTPGTPLMRRTLPTQGIEGTNVLGEIIQPPQLPELPFADTLKGSAPSDSDPCLLVALIAGAPMVVPCGVEVNPVIEVDAVDLSTGNITFDGSLKVRGDITSGMEVRVTGDVVVAGTIEAALVEAGGNISVNGGIIGAAETRLEDSRTARITCTGEVKARFIENAIISAGRSVNVEHQIRQSSVSSGERVLVGTAGSKQGIITGGSIQALKAISCGTIGSPLGSPTQVLAGLNPHTNLLLTQLEARRKHQEEEVGKLEKILAFLKANPGKAPEDVQQRAQSTHAQLAAELTKLEIERKKLLNDLLPLATAAVTASRRFCPGVTLQVGAKIIHLMEEQNGGKAVVKDGQVAIQSGR